MIAAAVPALMGFAAFLVGARSSVFGVFVALSVVVLAAALPRPSEWDDSVERAAAESLEPAIENASATEAD